MLTQEARGLGVVNLEKFARALRLHWYWYQWVDQTRPWMGMTLSVDSKDANLFSALIRVQIGDGRRASFWTDNWLSHAMLSQIAPTLFAKCKHKRMSVREVLTQDRWVQSIQHSINIELVEEYYGIWEKLSTTNTDDLFRDDVQDNIH
ncbi:uncharacterized protein LOC107304000 [Oryza brachyantha]|nr:uncharacterized protein LOC107304000 [Oryza brachyantha]